MSVPPPVPPIPAASLILLRQRGQQLQVLVGRRAADARAFPGATVFPGGKLEAQDADWPGAAHDRLAAAGYAALRETFEETGLLIAAGGEGAPEGVDVDAERRAVEAGRRRFAELARLWARPVGLSRLTPFARWITPQRAPYRFDTHFFLAEATAVEGAALLICAEFERLEWASPSALLADPTQRLITPTRHCLQVLSQGSRASASIEAARARGLIDGEAVRSGRP